MIVGLAVAAAGLVGWALEIWRNQPDLGPGAVAAVVGCAIGSTTVLISMVGHNWREAARKREPVRATRTSKT